MASYRPGKSPHDVHFLLPDFAMGVRLVAAVMSRSSVNEESKLLRLMTSKDSLLAFR